MTHAGRGGARATIAVAALVAALLTPSARAGQSDAAVRRERASALLANGDAAGALAAYRAALAIDPNDALAHDGIGVVLGDGGDLAGAIAAFRTAIARDPMLAVAQFHLGIALERAKQPREAIAAYTRSLRLNPALTEARFGLSSACASLGDLDGAIALLRQVVAAVPHVADAHYNLGIHLVTRYDKTRGPRRSADLDEAGRALETAARLAPDQARVHAALGRFLAERHDTSRAVERLRRARSLEPDRPDHAYDLGLALRLEGDFDGAETQLREALSADPRNGLARRALGLVLRTKGDLSGAASELRAAAAALPDDAQAHHLLGAVLLKLAETPAALAALQRAIELDASLTEPRVALAQALIRRGERDEARRQQEAVQRINAERSNFGRAMILVDKAREWLERNDGAAARKLLQEAVSLAPDFAEAHFQMALVLLRSYEARTPGNPPEPVRDPAPIEAAFRRVLELDPSDARVWFELGRFHRSRSEPAPALVALRRAVALSPGLVPAHRLIADLSAAGQDWRSTIDALDAVVAWQPDDSTAFVQLAAALVATRDCAGADAAFRHGLRLRGDAAAARPGLAAAVKTCAAVSPISLR